MIEMPEDVFKFDEFFLSESEMSKSEEKQPNTEPINVNPEGVRRRKPPNPELKPVYKLPEKEKPSKSLIFISNLRNPTLILNFEHLKFLIFI